MKCRCDIALAGYEWMKKRVEKNSGTGVLWFRFFLEHHRNGAAEEADKRCPKETTPLKTKQKTKQTQWKKKPGHQSSGWKEQREKERGRRFCWWLLPSSFCFVSMFQRVVPSFYRFASPATCRDCPTTPTRPSAFWPPIPRFPLQLSVPRHCNKISFLFTIFFLIGTFIKLYRVSLV